MTGRRAITVASQPPARHRSLSSDDAQYRFESQNSTTNAQSAASSHARRRPSRANSAVKDAPPSSSPPYADTDKGGEKRTQVGKGILKRPPRRDSLHVDTSLASPSPHREWEEDGDIGGFVPKLSQIREGKSSRASGNRSASTVSSTIEPQPLHRRHTDDNVSLGGSRLRRKRRSLQDRAGSFDQQPNPSSTSSLSGTTQRSTTSGQSNSTVTQKSYEEESRVGEQDLSDNNVSPKTVDTSNNSPSSKMGEASANVFQYLSQSSQIEHTADEVHYAMASSSATSSSSSSSGDEEAEDELSISVEELEPTTESSLTSPASTQKSKARGSRRQSRKYHNIGVPLYASSFVHGHGREESADQEDGAEYDGQDGSKDNDEHDENEAEEDDSEASSDDDHHEGKTDATDSSPEQNNALAKCPLPRAPSASSRHSDPHTRRLRQQERELANHVFKSPQPHKEFQFSTIPAAGAHAPMPLYSPQVSSGPSPASFHAKGDQPSGWPPMPPLPALLPIGYSPQATHMSPEARHALPLAVRPPMAAPETVVQQYGPPFPHYPLQPPHYQSHGPKPDLSRTTMVGYELLADKLSEPPKDRKPQKSIIVPLYRKFEHLNHRVLLHLQDEICELEEELRDLDECIAQTSPRDEAGHTFPASRRHDARYGNEAHHKRTELLGRIFQKLGQYNQALSSFNNLLKDLDPASPEAIRAYRAWLGRCEPIDSVEARFLERKHDLLTVSRKTSVSTTRDVGQPYPAAMWFPLTLALPIMAFAIIPSLLGRLVVIVLIGGVELKLVTSTPELMNFMSIQEWATAASM